MPLQFGLKVGLALVAQWVVHNRAAPASLIICCYCGVSSLLFPLISRPSVRANINVSSWLMGFTTPNVDVDLQKQRPDDRLHGSRSSLFGRRCDQPVNGHPRL